MADSGGLAAYRAVATLYNALMTALVLGLITRRGEEVARDYVFRHFRRQHLEKFLPGLHKLGLAGEPDAPACALYHYHSNALGGVKTAYLRESDRMGALSAAALDPAARRSRRAACGVGSDAAPTATMESAQQPGPGFICTGMTVDGMPGLELLFRRRPASEGRRARAFRLRRGGDAAGRLGQPARLETANWPGERRQHTFRSYALEYRHHAPNAGLWARPRRRPNSATPGRPQFHETARDMPADRRRRGDQQSAGFHWLSAILRAEGEDIETTERDGAVLVIQTGWRVARELALTDPLKAFDAWNELWLGAAAAHDRFLAVHTIRAMGERGWSISWRIAPR
jgi:hypothetical protein